MDKVDGKRMWEKYDPEFQAEEGLEGSTQFRHHLHGAGEENGVEARLEVSRIHRVDLTLRCTGSDIRMDIAFARHQRVEATIFEERPQRTLDDQCPEQEEERIQISGTSLEPSHVVVGDIQVGDEETDPETTAPVHGVPVCRDAPEVKAKSLPVRLDFADHDSTEQCGITELQLHGDGPKHTDAVMVDDTGSLVRD